MPRLGITYEQVAGAADAIVAEGGKPTIRTVREKLGGTGSPNTIHNHLSVWRGAHPAPAVAPPVLPQSVVAAITAEIDRAVAAAKVESQEQLSQSQAEATDLGKAGGALEAERDELLEQVAALTREKDELIGRLAQRDADAAAHLAQQDADNAERLAQRDAEIVALREELSEERDAAGKARVTAAEAAGRLAIYEREPPRHFIMP